jgi:hypothetical protein
MANFQLADNQKVPFTVTAVASNGFPGQLTAGDTLSVVSSDPTSVAVVLDTVPAAGSLASGFLVAGKNLQVGVSITASALKADGSVDLTVVTLVDVVAGVAVALALNLGAPVLQ